MTGIEHLQKMEKDDSPREHHECIILINEIIASLILSGGKPLKLEEIANMSVGQLLALAIPNKVIFRVKPDESNMRFHSGKKDILDDVNKTISKIMEAAMLDAANKTYTGTGPIQ